MKTSNRIAWSLVFSGLAAFPLLAQEPRAEEPVATYEDVLFVEESLPYIPDSNTIATKLPLPLQRTPASVGVVSEPLLEEQGGVVLGDALRNVSGVNVQTQSGVADFFSMHAFGFYWYVFNIADVAIVAGVVGLLYDSFMGES